MIRTALRDMRAYPLRSLLTAMSMFIGVLAVAGISAADQIASGYVVASHEQLRGREALFSVGVPWTATGPQSAIRMHDDLTARVGPQDAAVALVATAELQVEVDPGAMTMQSHWLRGELEDLYRRPLVTGIRVPPAQTLSPTVTINESAAQVLGIHELPVTLRARASGAALRTVVVTGVVTDGHDEPTVYGWLDEAITQWPDTISDLRADLYVRAPGETVTAVGVLVRESARVAQVTLEEEIIRRDTVAEARESVTVVRTAFAVSGAVALVVAAVGILNVGLASIGERSRELVIRRAIGARRCDIVMQVLGSHVLLAALVALLAVGTVLVAVHVVAPAMTPHAFIADPIAPSWRTILYAVAAAIVTSIAGATAPAIKASRLPVADALRT